MNHSQNIASTEPLYFIWEDYVQTSLCSIACVTNLINLIIFRNPKLNDQTYKFLLVIAFNDFAYSCQLMLLQLGKLCVTGSCAPNTKYAVLLLHIVCFEYTTSCLAIMNIFIELYMTVQRLSMVKNKKFMESISFRKIIIFLTIISFVYYSPVLFLTKIDTIYIKNSTMPQDYSLKLSSFGNSSIGRLIPTVLSLIRIFLVTVVLFVLNVITIISFKKYFAKKTVLRLKIVNLRSSNSTLFLKIKKKNIQLMNIRINR